MKLHEISVRQSGQRLPRGEELAWNIARVAADPAPLDRGAVDIAIDRIIDNAGVAIAAVNRPPVAAARAAALAHPRKNGANILGLPLDQTFDCEWAAWANGTAVRELDFHDSFFALESGHPGDNIPPLVAVAQQCGLSGEDLARGIITAYEIQIALAKAINLSLEKIDHVGHLGPSMAAGIGAMLRLPAETIYQAVQQAAHLSHAPRQARKGQISTWKAFAPGHVAQVAITAIDRAMRGQTSPSPIYEGGYGLIAAMLKGPSATYSISLPEPGEPRRAILETFTKEHSAGYHGQALIDLAFKLRTRIANTANVESIVLHTKKFTHLVMGSGADDPEKYHPAASRETLDHSAMFIFAVALQDGVWHHETSYTRERAGRADTVALWRKIRTVEDREWNARFYERDGLERDHGARAVVNLCDGNVIEEELAVANAHPRGAEPFARSNYIRKFEALTEGLVSDREKARFVGMTERLRSLGSGELSCLSVEVDCVPLDSLTRNTCGIF